MGLRSAATVVALLPRWARPLAAQKTGDQARLIFTVSGGYLQGSGLWTVRTASRFSDLPLADTSSSTAASSRTLIASASAPYFPKASTSGSRARRS